VNEFDAIQLMLAFNDVLFFSSLVPVRNDAETFEGHRVIVTWRQDPNRPEGWYRVKREFL
jgi:hypothetical protein